MEAIQLDPRFISIVPVLIGLLYGLQMAGLPKRFIPLMALFAGLIVGIMIAEGEIVEGLIIGGGLAVSAIGTHSGIKNTIQK